MGIAAFKAENDSPVSRDGHTPKTSVLALEPMKPKPRNVHPLGTVSGIQKSQNALDSFDLIGPDPAPIILLKEPL